MRWNARSLLFVPWVALVACALPNAGLMRYLHGNLTGVWVWVGQEAQVGAGRGRLDWRRL